ncbi:dihydroneopterin aldolase [Stutzerimonas stutzeri]|uniref:7,8-dihydroneopterin aldolase n=1 Tax=Stutzerimonas stutzeri KOS6 TaxID=1218352 RepID=A0A061JWA2_STUST|nr:dihydroneopterin aldolase [Stutzerimonas stutzeri]MBA4691581.1 dihydroneopterin aldolase [Pseudomonas sp.]EWC43045.1 dihydroneopterin triphosphate 2'-epimerase [Stutzerimonas stutzeri KOS6]MCQ4237926.1 dihydroneopterin aldolase [Stutzerimonas stutzeri]MDI9730424.1 dihydroneopterin aldolase [Stutzerimonas stutzeri]MDI9746766.1 dihydroneopterin aldolase [Stutzerimonas stutzeri]
MDTVFIEGLEVDTVIGAYDWERGIRQCLHLDLTLGWDIRPAAENDELDKALDYAKVVAAIDRFASAACFELVETFAERLAQSLMSEYGIVWLRLRVTKPGVNARARALGVEIERGCR